METPVLGLVCAVGATAQRRQQYRREFAVHGYPTNDLRCRRKVCSVPGKVVVANLQRHRATGSLTGRRVTMRIFHCERCRNIVPFTAQRCVACDAPLGYLSEDRTIRVLHDTDVPAVYEIEGRPGTRVEVPQRGVGMQLAGAGSVRC